MRGLLTAIGFLSVAPVGARAELREGEFGRAAVWFPLVGLLIGVALAGVDWCGRALWDAYVAAALVTAAAVVLTGGLHIDGLMDTADAFFSGQARERMLEIMRDARSGALGVAAGVCVLLAKFAAYAHLAGQETQLLPYGSTAMAGLGHWRVIAAAPVMGRLAMVIGAAAFPYARETGTGARFTEEIGARHALGAMAIAAIITVALLGLEGLAAFGLAIVSAIAGGAYAQRRLGGLTGDVYGATNELVEVGVLLVGGVILVRSM